MLGFRVVICGLIGFTVAITMVFAILRVCARIRFQRRADFHHQEKEAVPRFGGLALAAAFIVAEAGIAIFFRDTHEVPHRAVVILGSLAMFGLGFWDDLRPLGAKRKLAGQLLIASVVYWCGVGISQFKIPFSETVVAVNGLGFALTVMWLVGITNLMNLIDGADGLAAGIAFMLMVLLVYMGMASHSFVLLSAAMAGALLGFLCFNFPPARIYLGDGGAYFLGFQIAAFSLTGSQKGSVLSALIAPLFVLALPILDTALAILRRGLRGLPVFRPDRRHIHHRLLQSGMSHRRMALSLYGVTLIFLIMGFAAFWSRGHLVPILAGVGALVVLLCAGRLKFSREWLTVHRMVGESLAMRREVRYALCLSEWLRFESHRCRSLEDFFTDFLFAARRLGFTEVRVRLADGERVWSREDVCCRHWSCTQEILGGAGGRLTLGAPAGGKSDPMARDCVEAGEDSEAPKLHGVLAELLAETWTKSAQRWLPAQGMLRFQEPVALDPSSQNVRATRPGWVARSEGTARGA